MSTFDKIESETAEALDGIRAELADLRGRRDDLNRRIRELVAEERTVASAALAFRRHARKTGGAT